MQEVIQIDAVDAMTWVCLAYYIHGCKMHKAWATFHGIKPQCSKEAKNICYAILQDEDPHAALREAGFHLTGRA